MTDQRCCRRTTVPQAATQPTAQIAAQPSSMESCQPMNHYIGPSSPFLLAGVSRAEPCSYCCQSQLLLEQLVALSVQQNQLLVDLLGAVNSLTAALLTSLAQV